MNQSINHINIEGLKFFGKVNASISHELKNILAIISETAGFLNDLTDLAKQGKKLELSLLENCSESIAEDIQRGFATIQKMNQFAHSVDSLIKETDLMAILELTIKLTGFLSFASSVRIKNRTIEDVSVLTCPFLLQNMIYQVLIFASESIGPDGEIYIDIMAKKDGTHLVFSSPNKLTLKDFPTPKLEKSAEVLGIKLSTNTAPIEIDIWVPYVSNEIVALAKSIEIDPHTKK